ncbi:two-partner secretion domain-containing protein [Leptothoe spongobia]|uniref:Filamentous hemagglutinin N-terminal domain-containing protein n=1 Tax=Leptothoe spongobia TAU-MAC 1115 TaxID=1967444 RepID=A0A947DAU3_9CYAN|nr:filamentous hemagglutinin N-terminal domain-containing protein [Leptothoe spongobia]MBT9314015.1 filamentous hemagglutinin N-terminal domain-containing protein [Leptothoe spongobia TAU-MAC 1115]
MSTAPACSSRCVSVGKFLRMAVGLVMLGAFPASAQITSDASLGSRPSQITTDGTRELIQGGSTQGTNLFHSFSEFNVAEGQQVYFVNPNGIANILSRVTGTQRSDILGTLGVDGDANLFLLNPNGILFGPNAQLEMGGSFLASTADQLTFEDGATFSAVQPQQPLLTVSAPIGLHHGDRPNGNIINQGQLALSPEQQLTLFGHQVEHSGELRVPGGRVELLGHQIDVVGQAVIDVSSPGQGGVILVGGDYQGQPTRPTSAMTTVGAQTKLTADGIGTGNGGQVILWSDGITRFEGSILARGGAPDGTPDGTPDGAPDGTPDGAPDGTPDGAPDGTPVIGGTAGAGNGGFVEVSGKTGLVYAGQVDATATHGLSGTLLLDPTNVTIANGTGVNSLNVLFETVLEGLSGDTNLLITATNDIVLQDLADNALELQPGRGEVRFTADSDGDGVGAFIMEDVTADRIDTFGRDIAIAGANLQVGHLNTNATPNQDAGQLLNSAQAIGQVTGPALTTISGQLSHPTDVDLYEIYLSGTEPFSASTVTTNTASPNTQLFLFDATGRGLYGNDNDATCGCRQSTLQPGTQLPEGIYYLGIASYAAEPASSTGAIFSDGFATLNFNALEVATGPGQNEPLSTWINQPGIEVGGYDITLAGVTGVANQISEMPLSNSGAISLIATHGDIRTGQLTTTATNTGGDITVAATGGGLKITDTLNTLGSQGNGGRVSLTATGDIRFQPGASVLTRGQLAGDLSIQSDGEIVVQGGLFSMQSTTTDLTGVRGASFELQGQSLRLQNGAQIISETLGTVTLKDSRVEVQEGVTLSGLGSVNRFNPFSVLGTQVGSEATGNGGMLTLDIGTLSVTDAAVVTTRSFGRGNAGDLTIMGDEVLVSGAVQIDETLLLDNGESIFESELSTEAEREEEELLFRGGIDNPFTFSANEANAGDLRLDVGKLRVENGGEVSAGTHSLGNGGNFTIVANEVIVTGQMLGERSELGTETVPEFLAARPPEGNAGNLLIESDLISVTNGGQIATGTLALGGDAGRLEIKARDVEVSGGFVYQGNVNTSAIISEVLDPSNESVQGDTDRSFGGRGGAIDINAETLSLRNGGQISASTAGNGTAGDVTITVPAIELTGAFTPAIDLATMAQPRDTTPIPSGVFASSETEGQAAGNIQIATTTLKLNNSATLEASTQGDRGNITLTGGTVLMNNGGQITTNAVGTATGGNITLDLDLLIATPLLGNNDITANAEDGSGGQIRINSRSPILGFQVGDRDSFRAANLTPADRATNDITAFSQFNPAIDVGSVTIEPPEIDPTSGTVELPTLVDPSDRIATGCPAQRGNSFAVTGQGGLPPDPRRGLRGAAISHDFRLAPDGGTDGGVNHGVDEMLANGPGDQGAGTRHSPYGGISGDVSAVPGNAPIEAPIAEAQTWVKAANGSIRLINSSADLYALTFVSSTCQL